MRAQAPTPDAVKQRDQISAMLLASAVLTVGGAGFPCGPRGIDVDVESIDFGAVQGGDVIVAKHCFAGCFRRIAFCARLTAFGDVFDGGTFFVGVAFFASDHLDCLIVIIGIGGALDEHIFVQAISVVIGEQVTAFTDVGDIGGVIGAGAFRAGDIACFERVIGPDVTELTVAQIGTDVIGAEDRIAAVDAAGFEDGIFDGAGIVAISFFNAFGTFDIGDGANHVLSGAAFSVGIGGEDEFSSVTVAVSGNVPIKADSGFSEFGC